MTKHAAKRLIQNREWMIVVALALLVALLRLPSLELPFDNDSGANAYHARLIARGEPLYGTHHPTHHLPAVYYTYALAFLLFGDSVWAVKFLLILWTIAAAYLLYRLGDQVMDKATGVLAAIFYSILTSHMHLAGTTAEAELFVNLPRIAAVLVLMYLTARQAAAWKYVFVGVLGAAAFLFKAIYLSPLAMTGLVLLAELWQGRSITGRWQVTIRRGLWVAVGFVVGLLPVVIYFGLVGLLPRFLLVFQLGQEYVDFRYSTSAGPAFSPLYPVLILATNNAALFVFSLAGISVLVINRLTRHHAQRNGPFPAELWITVWYALSLIEAGISGIGFSHYALLVVPPLALLAAWFLVKLYRDVRNQIRSAGRMAATSLLTLLLAIALFFSVSLNFDFYERYFRYKLGLEAYEDFVGARSVRVQTLADYVRARTSTSDYVYYWSGDTQIYYLADRRCPIDTIWPLYAEATGPYQRIFAPQTEYVILGESNNIPRPDWLYAELAGKYALETIIEDQEVYRRID